MENNDRLINIMLIAIMVFGFLCILLGCAVIDAAPDKIKDTNCIYYDRQVYCLKENEV